MSTFVHRVLIQTAGRSSSLTRILAMIVLLSWAACAQAQDLALAAILQPNSGCALGSESVQIRIFNYGPTLPTGSSVLIAYSVNGGASVNEVLTFSSNLQSNTSLVHSFAVPADLSAPGNYLFTVGINPAGDINPGNNSISGYAVQNSALSVAGTLGGPASGSSGVLTLSGSIGSVVQWEESPDNLRWFKLANSSSTQSYSGLAAVTRFRVRVANTPCTAVVSNVHTVTP